MAKILSWVWRLLRSSGLALAIVAALATYVAAFAWLPSTEAGVATTGLGMALGIDQPFVAPPFLVLVALTFASTLACTLDRTRRTLALWRGLPAGGALELPERPDADPRVFLAGHGFRGAGAVLFRNRLALWGGWAFHAGLLLLIAGVAVQRAYHDGGAFELTVDETARLDAPRVVFGRAPGPLADVDPPALAVTLLDFDPYLHERGFDRDRRSLLRVAAGDRVLVEGTVDRVHGLDAGAVTLFQALPHGLALEIELADTGRRGFRLHHDDDTHASGAFHAPDGTPARLSLASTRSLSDPLGSGGLRVFLEQRGAKIELQPGGAFAFGATSATLVSVRRWSGFTYGRSPAMPAVFFGFLFVLGGAALLACPAGVAQLAAPGHGIAARVYVSRGRDLMIAEWTDLPSGLRSEIRGRRPES
ncbi:MAG: hypothetical protein HY903_00900 [Deltaproteobacteria bacterium]|nr:hypothetical protein [Deltaproteobacteria bacterium]